MTARLIADRFDPGLGGHTFLFELSQAVRLRGTNYRYFLLLRYTDLTNPDPALAVWPSNAAGDALGSKAYDVPGDVDQRRLLARFGVDQVLGYGDVEVQVVGF